MAGDLSVVLPYHLIGFVYGHPHGTGNEGVSHSDLQINRRLIYGKRGGDSP
jgi:hypothetical protein